MKKRFYFGLLTLMSFSMALSSCSNNDDENPIDNTQQIAQIEANIESGTWRVTSLIDLGLDKTSDFTGYNFTFESNGTLTASNGTTTLSGTWSVANDSSDDDGSNDIEFNIFFPVSDSNDFEELNEDWDIVSTSATKIELSDISDDNVNTDRLTFEKN